MDDVSAAPAITSVLLRTAGAPRLLTGDDQIRRAIADGSIGADTIVDAYYSDRTSRSGTARELGIWQTGAVATAIAAQADARAPAAVAEPPAEPAPEPEPEPLQNVADEVTIEEEPQPGAETPAEPEFDQQPPSDADEDSMALAEESADPSDSGEVFAVEGETSEDNKRFVLLGIGGMIALAVLASAMMSSGGESDGEQSAPFDSGAPAIEQGGGDANSSAPSAEVDATGDQSALLFEDAPVERFADGESDFDQADAGASPADKANAPTSRTVPLPSPSPTRTAAPRENRPVVAERTRPVIPPPPPRQNSVYLENAPSAGVPVRGPSHRSGSLAAREFPTPPGGREVRAGTSVTVEFTVMPNGRAQNCRVVVPGPDPSTNNSLCPLVVNRLTFNPAVDANGNPVPAPFRWRQDFF